LFHLLQRIGTGKTQDLATYFHLYKKLQFLSSSIFLKIALTKLTTTGEEVKKTAPELQKPISCSNDATKETKVSTVLAMPSTNQ
jgi:hypothetical protein